MAKIKGLTDITIILDRSGSMDSIYQATKDGLNGFVKEQKATKGEARFTLVQFDGEGIERVYDNVPIGAVTDIRFVPRGSTPLFDAIGETLTNYKTKAEKSVIVIITDGMENASRIFTRQKVKSILDGLQAKGHQVLFLAANLDAFAYGSSFGTRSTYTRNFQPNYGSTTTMYDIVSSTISDYRTGEAATAAIDSSVPETIVAPKNTTVTIPEPQDIDSKINRRAAAAKTS